MEKIRPMGSRVLVKRLAQEEMINGIYVPESKKKQPRASVLAIGPDVTQVKIGDIILLDKYAPQSINLDDKEYEILKADDIIAIIDICDDTTLSQDKCESSLV